MLMAVAVVCGFWLLSATAGDALWQIALPEPTPGYVAPTRTPAPVDWALVRGDAAISVWASESGSRYHENPTCSNMRSAVEMPLDEAQARGLSPCVRCW